MAQSINFSNNLLFDKLYNGVQSEICTAIKDSHDSILYRYFLFPNEGPNRANYRNLSNVEKVNQGRPFVLTLDFAIEAEERYEN